MSYAQLLFSGDSSDARIARFYQSMSEKVTEISTELLFFTLELNRLDESVVKAKLADPALSPWASWIEDLRVFQPHQLSDELETLLHEKDVSGAAAWSRLFDETMAGLRVPVGDERLTVSDALNRLSDRDRDTRAKGRGRHQRDSGRQSPPLLPHHEYARQGQGDGGPLAPLSAARQFPQSLQHGRGRGGGCAS